MLQLSLWLFFNYFVNLFCEDVPKDLSQYLNDGEGEKIKMKIPGPNLEWALEVYIYILSHDINQTFP